MVTFTINIPPMLAYIPYMDPMGNRFASGLSWFTIVGKRLIKKLDASGYWFIDVYSTKT